VRDKKAAKLRSAKPQHEEDKTDTQHKEDRVEQDFSAVKNRSGIICCGKIACLQCTA
jgi:hypothetical protein